MVINRRQTYSSRFFIIRCHIKANEQRIQVDLNKSGNIYKYTTSGGDVQADNVSVELRAGTRGGGQKGHVPQEQY